VSRVGSQNLDPRATLGYTHIGMSSNNDSTKFLSISVGTIECAILVTKVGPSDASRESLIL